MALPALPLPGRLRAHLNVLRQGTAEGAAEMDTEASASPFLSVPTASARTTWRPRLAGKTTAKVLEDALTP